MTVGIGLAVSLCEPTDGIAVCIDILSISPILEDGAAVELVSVDASGFMMGSSVIVAASSFRKIHDNLSKDKYTIIVRL